MKLRLNRFKYAAELPNEWDLLVADNIYLHKNFLSFIEKTENDYKPVYYLFYDGDKADSCFIAHKRKKYNLGMFTKTPIKITVTLIYLPMSVTQSGIVLGKLKDEVLEAIKSINGFKMILNLTDNDIPEFAVGYTCPKCILTLKWNTFDDYLKGMRSGYRNHYKRILKKSEDIRIRYIDNRTEFTNELYGYYLNVRKHSNICIETLSKEYFEGEMFKLFVAEYKGHAVGFTQLLENGDELVFEFVGIDYSFNISEIPIYHRMLLEIIRYGIENGFKAIDFGQTADDSKLKLGSQYVFLYAALHHSCRLINSICIKLAPKLQYKPLETVFHVFREDENI